MNLGLYLGLSHRRRATVLTATPSTITITPSTQSGTTRVKKTGGTTSWSDAGAYIGQPLNGDFRVNYKNPDVTKIFACGLVADPAAAQDYSDFNGLMHNLTDIQDINTGSVGSSLATGANNDTFGIGRIGSQLVRWRNGVEFGTRRSIGTGSLFFDMVLNLVDSQIDDIDPSGDETTGSAYEVGAITILERSTAQSIPNSTDTDITWSREVQDDVNAWSSGTTITAPSGYSKARFTIFAHWATNGTNWRFMGLKKNGTLIEGNHSTVTSGVFADRIVTKEIDIAAGNTFVLFVWQNSGGALNFAPHASDLAIPAYIQVEWIV